MKLVHYQINKQFDFDEFPIFSLVIENQDFFREVVTDLSGSSFSENGFVLSKGGEIINKGLYIDVTKDFAPFDVNSKSLSSKLISYFEKKAISSDYYLDTQSLLWQIENYINNISFNLPFDIECKKINITALLKAIGVEIQDDYADPLMGVLDYFEVVRELFGEKIFVMINMRSYFSDEQMQLFINSVIDASFHVLFIESMERQILNSENRVLIDFDLCEI